MTKIFNYIPYTIMKINYFLSCILPMSYYFFIKTLIRALNLKLMIEKIIK